MTLQECYEAMGGDYQDVISRLRSDRLVQKFVLKFLDDASFDLFCSSMESKNYEEAFRAVHNKGHMPESRLQALVKDQLGNV